jgi:hypothetical protein
LEPSVIALTEPGHLSFGISMGIGSLLFWKLEIRV